MNKVFTTCEGCIFFKPNEENLCKLGRLDKYLERGCSIDIVDNIPVIQNRICLAKRNVESDWYKEYGEDVERVNNEIAIRLDAIVYLDNSFSIDDLKKTLNSIQEQTFKPTIIRVIFNAERAKLREVADTLDSLSVEFDLAIILDRNCGEFLSKDECIDIAVKKINQKKCSYYVDVNCGTVLVPNMFEFFNNLICKELYQYLIYQNGSLTFYNLLFHNKMNGCMPVVDSDAPVYPLVDKAKKLIKEDESWKKSFVLL